MTTYLDVGTVAGVRDPAAIAQQWLDSADAALAVGDTDALTALVLPAGWWRDQLALTWQLRTAHGPDQVGRLLTDHAMQAGLGGLALTPGKQPTLVGAGAGVQYVQAFFDFGVAVGRGQGVLRLMPDEDGRWLAWTVLTALRELRGHEERVGGRRPLGTVHGRTRDTDTWPVRRARERAFFDRDPDVLVVGAGHSGLAVAARLGQLGVSTLLIDSHTRVGDNWRTRYDSLVLHDPVWYDHMPYLPFPETWPVYTPKDKLADWLESYADTMELDVWNSTSLTAGSYDDASATWTVTVAIGDGTSRTLHPRHLVLATGLQSEPRLLDVPGLAEFGGAVVHSSRYADGSSYAGKRAVVVGAGVSGHDIAQDLFNAGADVTLVQRSSTCVVSTEHGIAALFDELYGQGSPPTEDADLLFASVPYNLLAQLHVGLTAQLKELDADLLTGLEAAGFKTDFGEDGSGIFMKVLRRGGGYYVDVGCSTLITTGDIAVAQGAGVARLEPDAVVLDDGRRLPADLVVLATGFESMRETARRLLGDAEADRSDETWGLDDEGEIQGVWRPNGHPGLWYMAGNLQLSRYFSRLVALQLKADIEGLRTA